MNTATSTSIASPPAPALPPRERFDAFLRWMIEVEHAAAPSFLPEDECRPFLDYYQALPKPGDEAAIARYLRGAWHAEAGWTARWIARRLEKVRPGDQVRVLDAGSGFGTYAMLYAAMGAAVTGVDVRPDRLSAAERRLAYHARETGEVLDVRYERADATREWPRDYDLVWVYNALSHIDPLDGFLEATRRHLRPGGVLVVGDINGSHPAHLRRLAAIRTEIHQEYVAPDGQRHAYAVERPFPPAEIRRILEGHGFRMVNHELYWGGLGVVPEPLYPALVALQKLWRAGVSVARRQLVVATPAGSTARS